MGAMDGKVPVPWTSGAVWPLDHDGQGGTASAAAYQLKFFWKEEGKDDQEDSREGGRG